MGELNRQPIAKWRVHYGLRAMLETGTDLGNGVAAGLAAGFPTVATIDVNPACVHRLVQRFPGKLRRVHFYLGDSVEKLPQALKELPTPALFWLDAHYPDVYLSEDARAEALPLLQEVRTIVEHDRDHSGDVFVMDDLRIYGAHCAAGKLPQRARGAELQTGDPEHLFIIRDLLWPTHSTFCSAVDAGYLVALPRECCPC